ncbi:hypothetical protein BKA80DRAFT_31800 [Phyllosticta citrichinensis]
MDGFICAASFPAMPSHRIFLPLFPSFLSLPVLSTRLISPSHHVPPRFVCLSCGATPSSYTHHHPPIHPPTAQGRTHAQTHARTHLYRNNAVGRWPDKSARRPHLGSYQHLVSSHRTSIPLPSSLVVARLFVSAPRRSADPYRAQGRPQPASSLVSARVVHPCALDQGPKRGAAAAAGSFAVCRSVRLAGFLFLPWRCGSCMHGWRGGRGVVRAFGWHANGGGWSGGWGRWGRRRICVVRLEGWEREMEG